MTLLIGTESYGPYGGGSYIFGGKWQCAVSGILDELKIYSLLDGNAKMGIYAYGSDDSETGELLSVNNSGVACVNTQWNSIAMPEVALVAGEVYWICSLTDSASVISAASGGQDFRETTTSYASGLPATVEWGDDFSYTLSFAGYGNPSGMSPMAMRTI
jgi:hypothetical protein